MHNADEELMMMSVVVTKLGQRHRCCDTHVEGRTAFHSAQCDNHTDDDDDEFVSMDHDTDVAFY